MKRLWLSLAILLLLGGGIMAHAVYLEESVAELTRQLQTAQAAAEEEHWAQAARITRSAALEFREKADYFHITLKHQDVNDIETAFQEVLQFLTHREQLDEYAAANARLIMQLELLTQSEELSLNNIL